MICHLYDHQGEDDDEGFYSGHRVSLTTLKCFPRFQSLPVCVKLEVECIMIA